MYSDRALPTHEGAFLLKHPGYFSSSECQNCCITPGIPSGTIKIPNGWGGPWNLLKLSINCFPFRCHPKKKEHSRKGISHSSSTYTRLLWRSNSCCLWQYSHIIDEGQVVAFERCKVKLSVIKSRNREKRLVLSQATTREVYYFLSCTKRFLIAVYVRDTSEAKHFYLELLIVVSHADTTTI